MEVVPGTRLRSAVCSTEVVVIKAPARAVELHCGGMPAVAVDASGPGTPNAGAPRPGQDGGSALGKRYVHEASGLEVLCTRGGAGTLSVAGQPLAFHQAKPLPSSD